MGEEGNKNNKKKTALSDKINLFLIKYFTRIPFVQKTFFVDHLRTMVHAGLSLVESLDILAKEIPNKKFKIIIKEVKKEVEGGQQLSEVLAKHPKIFPPIYVKMIASGELSGKLEESLEQVTIGLLEIVQYVSLSHQYILLLMCQIEHQISLLLADRNTRPCRIIASIVCWYLFRYS